MEIKDLIIRKLTSSKKAVCIIDSMTRLTSLMIKEKCKPLFKFKA